MKVKNKSVVNNKKKKKKVMGQLRKKINKNTSAGAAGGRISVEPNAAQ